MPKRKEFSVKDKIKMLLWSDRHCCLCEKECGANIEIHHIDKENDNRIENGIPVCFECHGLIHAYKKNPKGSGFKAEELKIRRNQIYDRYTAYLVPTLKFDVTQVIGVGNKMPLSYRKLPDVGFDILHTGGAFPVVARVSLVVLLDGKVIENFSSNKNYYYNGTKDWHLNPGNGVLGHFSIPSDVIQSKEELKIVVKVKMYDIYGHEHKQLPVEYIYMRDKNNWYLEP